MDPSLRRSPVYQQLNERLRSRLASDYASGDRFLSEREISDTFQVSRATANKVLAGLVSEGILEFRRGVGTFVRSDLNHYDLQSLVSFSQKAKSVSKVPSTDLLGFLGVPADEVDPMVADALEVSGKEMLWEMNRLRRADGVPVILEHRHVIAQHCPQLTRSQASGSLYQTLTEEHGLAITGAEEIIRAVCLSAAEASLLNVATRSPALEVTAVGFCGDRQPLWWERTLYCGDQYEFHSRLGPVQSASPVRGHLR